MPAFRVIGADMQFFNPITRFMAHISPFSARQDKFDEFLIHDTAQTETRPQALKSEPKEDSMRILVDRYISDEDTTLSKLYIDGVYQCDGLEPDYRKNHAAHHSRIPAGIYKLGVRTTGGYHNRYSKMFPWHKGMLHVLNVEGRKWILHHIGNYHTNTKGCLLVGSADEKAMTVWISKNAYKNYYKKVIDAAIAGNATIEYRDSDR